MVVGTCDGAGSAMRNAAVAPSARRGACVPPKNGIIGTSQLHAHPPPVRTCAAAVAAAAHARGAAARPSRAARDAAIVFKMAATPP
jgi:hypothetical protein